MCITCLTALCLISLGVPFVSGSSVVLSAPQSDYYFMTGETAEIPLTIGNTYDHDIQGTLRQTFVPVSGTNGTSGAAVRTRAFSAFTESRNVTLLAGTSANPGDYLLTIAFIYTENGGRIATLGPVRIHFVTSPGDTGPGGDSLAGTDTESTAGSSEGSSGGSSGQESSGKENPSAALQNSQIYQNTSSLKQQLAGEENVSRSNEADLREYLFSDPLYRMFNQSLAGAGFFTDSVDITPVSNNSGTFLLAYSSGKENARVQGYLDGGHILYAGEFSGGVIPLPQGLPANATHLAYLDLVTGKGFLRNETRINLTPDKITTDIIFSNGGGRFLHERAVIVNGTVTEITVDSPDDPFAAIIPVISAILVLALCAGILFLARHRPLPVPVQNGQKSVPEALPRETAFHLLDEAEAAAGRGSYPDAYRLTGRALRVYLSKDTGGEGELTGEEAALLAQGYPAYSGRLQTILERCSIVGFAKGIPDPVELRDIIEFSRTLLHHSEMAEQHHRCSKSDRM